MIFKAEVYFANYDFSIPCATLTDALALVREAKNEGLIFSVSVITKAPDYADKGTSGQFPIPTDCLPYPTEAAYPNVKAVLQTLKKTRGRKPKTTEKTVTAPKRRGRPPGSGKRKGFVPAQTTN